MQLESLDFLLNLYNWKKFAVLYPAYIADEYNTFFPETRDILQALKKIYLKLPAYDLDFISFAPNDALVRSFNKTASLGMSNIIYWSLI